MNSLGIFNFNDVLLTANQLVETFLGLGGLRGLRGLAAFSRCDHNIFHNTVCICPSAADIQEIDCCVRCADHLVQRCHIEGYTDITVVQSFGGNTDISILCAFRIKLEIAIVAIPVGHQCDVEVIAGDDLVIEGDGLQCLGVSNGNILILACSEAILRNFRLGLSVFIHGDLHIFNDTVCSSPVATDIQHCYDAVGLTEILGNCTEVKGCADITVGQSFCAYAIHGTGNAFGSKVKYTVVVAPVNHQGQAELLTGGDLVVQAHGGQLLAVFKLNSQVFTGNEVGLGHNRCSIHNGNQGVFGIGVPVEVIHINGIAGGDHQSQAVNSLSVGIFHKLDVGAVQLAVVPTVAAILGKHEVYAVTAHICITGDDQGSRRSLVAKIEPCAQGTLGHIGQCRQLSVFRSSLGAPGVTAVGVAGSNQLQGANSVAALQVGSHKGESSIAVERAGIGGHIDPVGRNVFQYLVYLLVLKLTGIHISHGLHIDTMENQTNTNDVGVQAGADLQVFHIYFTVVPAVAHRLQLEVNTVTDGPLIIQNIQRNLFFQIFELKVSAELTTGHIRQFFEFLLRTQTDKVVSLSLFVVEKGLQRTGRAFAHGVLVVVLSVNTLPANIQLHIFPALLHGFIGENIAVVNFRIYAAIDHIQIIQIEVKCIAICGAIGFVTEFHIDSTGMILVSSDTIQHAQLTQGEEDLCPLTGLCDLLMGTFRIAPVNIQACKIIGQTELELNGFIIGVVDPEGQNCILPVFICKVILNFLCIQGKEGITKGMGVYRIKVNMKRCGGIFTLNEHRVVIDALCDTAICRAMCTIGLQQIIQRICTDNGRNQHSLAGFCFTPCCSNGHHSVGGFHRCVAKIFYFQHVLNTGKTVGCIVISSHNIEGSGRIFHTLFHVDNITNVKGLIDICIGHILNGANLQRLHFSGLGRRFIAAGNQRNSKNSTNNHQQ